jgi:hypothetical protein
VTDHRTNKPISRELLDVFAKQLAYDPGSLNARIEWTNDREKDFVRQKITFDAGYNGERTTLHLFLPKSAQPPYRTVVFAPGAYAFANPGPSDDMLTVFPGPEEFVVKSGLALAYPIYDGSYERWRGTSGLTGAELLRYNRTLAAHRRRIWAKPWTTCVRARTFKAKGSYILVSAWGPLGRWSVSRWKIVSRLRFW